MDRRHFASVVIGVVHGVGCAADCLLKLQPPTQNIVSVIFGTDSIGHGDQAADTSAAVRRVTRRIDSVSVVYRWRGWHPRTGNRVGDGGEPVESVITEAG